MEFILQDSDSDEAPRSKKRNKRKAKQKSYNDESSDNDWQPDGTEEVEPAPIMISSADVTDIDDDVIDDDEFEPPGFRVQGAKGKKPVKKLYNNTKKLIVGPAGNLSNFQNLFGNSITMKYLWSCMY